MFCVGLEVARMLSGHEWTCRESVYLDFLHSFVFLSTAHCTDVKCQ